MNNANQWLDCMVQMNILFQPLIGMNKFHLLISNTCFNKKTGLSIGKTGLFPLLIGYFTIFTTVAPSFNE
jgi:hypothetical protein